MALKGQEENPSLASLPAPPKDPDTSINIPTSQMKKLRHREAKYLPVVSWLVVLI